MSQANSHQIQAQQNLWLATLGFAVSFACWGIEPVPCCSI
ncbi:hypothetical protein AmaxDRAFT_1824 [Limnospira maxima CS-328]|uniref:Uncharacterized protein n=2 Tax=Limnospira TaxID=2596745 RepID=A0A9P1KAW6_9CYAN|nr:hypothetical protein AmaxDRAFT_1824 [Limnospira maxima CS-328]CDM92659.1 conserved protein of unknown function [Limnospira indica PCC 8005]